MSVTIANTTKSKYPTHSYETWTNDILGKKYTVSLVFVGEKRAQQLNHTYRDKTYIPNVLSFPLTATAGEVYICLKRAQSEAHTFNLTPKGYVGYLYIHALLHLKGLDHGDTMDKAEAKYISKYALT